MIDPQAIQELCPAPASGVPGPRRVLPSTLGPDSRAPGETGTYPRPGPTARALRNSLFNLIVQGFQSSVYLVVFVILARVLGKDDFGRLYTFLALLMTVQLVLEAGTSTVLTCRLVRSAEAKARILEEAGRVLTATVLTTAAIFPVIGGLWGGSGSPAERWFCIGAVAIGCIAIHIQRFCAGTFRASEKFGFENGARALQALLYAVLVLVLTAYGAAVVETVLAAFAFSHVTAALLLAAGFLRWFKTAVRPRLSVLRDWLKESLPLGAGDSIRGPTWQLDTLLLGVLRSHRDVGTYSVVNRPLGPLGLLPASLLAATFPTFVRLAARDRDALGHAFARSVRLLWAGSLPVAVAIWACAGPLVLLLAGEAYREATLPMGILIWKVPLSFVSAHYRFLFAALGRPQAFARLVIGVFLLETVLHVLLIPRWGYLGACSGTLMGEIAFTALGMARCRRLGIPRLDLRPLARAALAGALMGGLLWPARGLSPSLLAPAVVLATGAYFALCLMLGVLSRDEVRRLCVALGRTSRSPERPDRAADPARQADDPIARFER